MLAIVLLMTGCAWFAPRQSIGPGAPHIANLRFDPVVVRAGQFTQMTFYFEVGSADLKEGFLIERGIQEFQFFQALQTIPISLQQYEGLVAGTPEIPVQFDKPGIRLLELYVVTAKGKTSNHLQATLTVY